MRFVILILIIFSLAFAVAAQSQSKSYSETRKLLLKMNRTHANEQLVKLFEEADLRMQDLIQALDDSEQEVRLNSQAIINYLAEPQGLQAIDEWKKRQTGTFAIPNVKLLTEKIYLDGNNSNLVKLVRKNIHLFQIARFDKRDISIELVAYNKKTKTALFEIIQGQTFTEGWHSVIKFESNKWRLVSETNVWQS
jgi:hypothetical protein